VGIILAGGLSRRMGGGDKTLRLLAGRPILQHVIDRLAPQVELLAINANGDPARFGPFGLPIVPDSVPGHVGPLAGVLAGLDWAEAAGQGEVVTVPSDAPFLPDDLADRLTAARAATGARIAIAASGGRRHFVIGLWPHAIADVLRAALVESGLRRVGAFVESLEPAVVEFAGHPLDPFHNINTEADLADAERFI
jgi:molybdopterin-guanine dinucleotide biosynthesis protein A